jgi:hypothetical protein
MLSFGIDKFIGGKGKRQAVWIGGNGDLLGFVAPRNARTKIVALHFLYKAHNKFYKANTQEKA